MKAALYQGVYNIEIADLPDYECGDDAITDKMAALIEPFTVGCRAARRGMPQKG